MSDHDSEKRTFTDQAEAGQRGLVREFLAFLKHEKKWWLAPVIVVLLLVGALILLAGTALAPFIYPVF